MKKYESLNGLRAIAAIGIVIMHVKANIDVDISGNFLYSRIIPVMSDFVYLFMMISAFSLCCGYYGKFKSGNITPNDFYKRRYSRILPFFAVLVLLSVAIPHNPNKVATARAASLILGSSGLPPFVEKLIEGTTELTLLYGILPNPSMSIMGVGWFLGVIFLFYLFFPFFVFMMDNKWRAWKSLIIANALCFFCVTYFFSEKFLCFEAIPKSFLYNAPFFAAGGVLFLYKDNIEEKLNGKIWLCVLICIILTILYWNSIEWKYGYFKVLIISCVMTAWLTFAIGCPNKVLHNKIIDYLSGISMEIYLSHMLSFRAVSMLHLSRYIQQPDLLYWSTCILTLAVAICFSHSVKYIIIPLFKKHKN